MVCNKEELAVKIKYIFYFVSYLQDLDSIFDISELMRADNCAPVMSVTHLGMMKFPTTAPLAPDNCAPVSDVV